MEGFKAILALILSFTCVAAMAQDGSSVGSLAPKRFERREVVINSYLRDQTLDVLRSTGLSGMRNVVIESVEVRAYTDASVSASLYLYSDGRVVAQDYYPSNFSQLRPYPAIDLNYTRNVDLSVRGKLYIERVVVNYYRQSAPPTNPPGNQIVLTGRVNNVFYAPARIDIASITNLYGYRNYQISAVTVNGRGLRSGGMASLMINGTVEGRINLMSYSSSQMIYPRGAYIVGSNVSSVILLLEGSSEINTVQIHLTRF